MSGLAAIRQELAQALDTPEAPALHYLAETINPPAIVLVPAEDYVTPGDVFGSWELAYTILLIAEGASTEEAADNLDNMIDQALTNLADWTIKGVAQPHTVTINGNPGYLASAISVTTHITT